MTSVAGSYRIEQENIRERTLFENVVAKSVGQAERRWIMKRVFMAAIGLCLVLGLVFGAAMTVVANVDEGLLALWHMGEGSGSIIHDASGNGFDGTIYGATWTDGICGEALEFDGMDDYVGCGSIPVGAPAYESFTLEAWINTTSTSGVIIQRQYAGHWFHLMESCFSCPIPHMTIISIQYKEQRCWLTENGIMLLVCVTWRHKN